MMTPALVLAFRSSEGKICNIKITRPRADVTHGEAEAVMNDIIAKDVFMTASKARLVAIESIYTTVTTRNELKV